MKTNLSQDWQEIRKEIYSEEENAASDLRVAIIGEIIQARESADLSQMSLSKLSGVKQPVIARMEIGSSDPRLSTMLKILAPLGKTLKVVDL